MNERSYSVDDADSRKWCNAGKHSLAPTAFAKGQATCRDCRRRLYAGLNYSHGKQCQGCGVAVVNHSKSL